MPDAALEREALRLFEQMLDVPEPERDAWIAAQTDGAPELAARIHAIRDADRRAELRTGAAVEAAEEEPPPERIGAYRIVERIGRGGMGSVYRGERAAGDFAHVVAIKIIKPGLLSEALVERFERERQLLAQLRHDHIAQLYDGGEVAPGSPYIVMEHVDGLPLLQWLDERQPARASRLKLFSDICAAVAFAHSNLIVHRDLTPSNVLVTHGGAAKVIDFGIAKAVDAAGGATPAGSLAGLSFTPGYAAPERMTSNEVATAADIYSLGRLLEKILPAGTDRELAAIAAKASAPAPTQRYQTVDALAADVVAWDRNLPVTAIKSTSAYVAGKFIRRNLAGLAAAAAVLAVLVVALALTLFAYSRAETARQAEAARFQDLRSLAHFMLFDLNGQMQRVAGNTGARVTLASEAQTYLSALAQSAQADEGLRLEAAQGFVELARILGVPGQPNLGDNEGARANLATAEELLSPLAQRSTDAQATLANAQGLRALILFHVDAKQEEAQALLDKAQAALNGIAVADRKHAWIEAQREVRKAALDLADRSNKHALIPALAKALEDDIAAWPADMQAGPAPGLDRATAVYYRGLERSMGKTAEDYGVPLFLDAEAKFDALQVANRNDPMILYMSARNAYMGFAAASKAGQEDISNRLILKARDTIDHLLTIEERDDELQAQAGNIKEALSQNLRDQDRFAEALALQQDVVASRRTAFAKSSTPKAESNLYFSLMILGLIARTANNRDLTCASWREAEAGFSSLKTRELLLGFHASFLAGLQANLKKCDEGAPLAEFVALRQ